MNTFLVALPSGKRIDLVKEETMIGRNKGSDITLNDGMVSRRHCVISKKGIVYYITDLDSTNGTYINGHEIKSTIRLRNNDTISLGQNSAAYQFRNSIIDPGKLTDTIRKPMIFIPLCASLIILAFASAFFFLSGHPAKIDLDKELAQLKAVYGANVVPDDPEFYVALRKTIATIQADLAFETARSQRLVYKELIERILIENMLPTDFSYIPWVESGYYPKAYNAGSRAAGMWQLIPETARNYGLKVDRFTDERFDPVKSTQAAAACLKDLVAVFGANSFLIILAAYNAGDNAILYGLKQIEDPVKERNFWYLYKYNLIPDETKKYVLTILGLILVNGNRDAAK
jgi:hypothetical protein